MGLTLCANKGIDTPAIDPASLYEIVHLNFGDFKINNFHTSFSFSKTSLTRKSFITHANSLILFRKFFIC